MRKEKFALQVLVSAALCANALLALASLSPSTETLVSTGGPYVLRAQAVTSSGSRSLGSGYALAGTGGEAAASASGGGPYVVRSGFQVPAEAVPDQVFVNGFENTGGL